MEICYPPTKDEMKEISSYNQKQWKIYEKYGICLINPHLYGSLWWTQIIKKYTAHSIQIFKKNIGIYMPEYDDFFDANNVSF